MGNEIGGPLGVFSGLSGVAGGAAGLSVPVHGGGRRGALSGMGVCRHPGGGRQKQHFEGENGKDIDKEAESPHPRDAGGAAGPEGPGAGRYASGQAHQNTEEDLDVYEVPSGRDKLQRDRPGFRGDPAYGGKMV